MSEPDVSQLLTVDQAIRIIDAAPVFPRPFSMPLNEAMGHYMCEDLRADRDYPPFDKSLMDGYAVRSADVTTTPATLKVIGEIPAGQLASRGVGPGEAYAIMTGSPMPPNADAVVPVEDTTADPNTGTVRIQRTAVPHRYIARQASDTPKGAVVLSRGTRIGPAHIAAAATIAAQGLPVFSRPSVGLFATGDEIIPVSSDPGPAQIRDSNTPMLIAMLHRLGCHATDLGRSPDYPDSIRHRMLIGLRQFDTLFITGGMSMGRHDHVPRLLQEAGVQLHITKLRIKPGKPFLFGTYHHGMTPVGPAARQSTFVFGLPGNPVSSYVCTLRLASRLLTRQAGGDPREKWTSGVLSHSLPANGPREFYHPVRLQWDSDRGTNAVHPLDWKGSADLFTLAAAGGLLVRPENDVPLSAGAAVRVLEI